MEPAGRPSGRISDHGQMSDAGDIPAALLLTMDLHMWRILRSAEDPVEVVAELGYELTAPALMNSVECAGRLYVLFADLGDIVDGWPVDYGAATEMIAQREIRDAAWDWLEAVRTAQDVESYLGRWAARGMALRVSEEGHPRPGIRMRKEAG